MVCGRFLGHPDPSPRDLPRIGTQDSASGFGIALPTPHRARLSGRSRGARFRRPVHRIQLLPDLVRTPVAELGFPIRHRTPCPRGGHLVGAGLDPEGNCTTLLPRRTPAGGPRSHSGNRRRAALRTGRTYGPQHALAGCRRRSLTRFPSGPCLHGRRMVGGGAHGRLDPAPSPEAHRPTQPPRVAQRRVFGGLGRG